MFKTPWPGKKALLFFVLASFFLTNAILAEFLGVKIFSLEQTFGFKPIKLHLLESEPFSFNLTTGVLLWPIVFVIGDIINEYFGPKGVRFLSYITAIIISYAALMAYMGINLAPADFWVNRALTNGSEIDMQVAYEQTFGQGLWIVAGSLVAFILAQILDVLVFQAVKRATGERSIWLRATGSTLVSQLVDSFVILFIAFYIGAGWSMSLFISVAIVNYIYKALAAIAITPLLYGVHWAIERFLGAELAEQLRSEAVEKVIPRKVT